MHGGRLMGLAGGAAVQPWCPCICELVLSAFGFCFAPIAATTFLIVVNRPSRQAWAFSSQHSQVCSHGQRGGLPLRHRTKPRFV